MDTFLKCLDTTSDSFIDLGIAPPLLFYSYVPILIVVVVFGIFSFFKSKNISGILFLAFSLLVGTWIISAILNWVAVSASVVAFSWQIIFIIDPLIYIVLYYFIYYFENKRLPSFIQNLIHFLFFVIIIFLLPSKLNFLAFDIYNCENIDGMAWNISYLYQLLIILALVVLMFKNKLFILSKRPSLLLVSGSIIFLTVFLITNFLGDYTAIYEFNLFGPLGLFLLVLFMSVVISKYKLFNIKLIIPQILIAILLFLNFAMLFIQDISNTRIVLLVTILITLIIGTLLIKSVKKVEQQREMLAIANEEQETLLHFITHQIKGFFTKSRNIFSMLKDGDAGKIPEYTLPYIEEGLKSDETGIQMVQDILNAASLKNGHMIFNKKTFDLVSMVKNLISKFDQVLQKKGLKIEFETNSETINFSGDPLHIENAFRNLIENSISYTEKGDIKIKLESTNDQVVFEVKDSGLGLTSEDKKRLFQKGGRGQDARKLNTNSTGYGLFIVKQIVDEHQGLVRAESEGRNRGSQFIITLPLIKSENGTRT